MRIELVRSGGFGNLVVRRAVDTDEMAPEDAEALDALVSRIDLDALSARSPVRGRGADRFQYDLTVTRDGEARGATVDEGEAPPDLRALFERVMAHGRPVS